MEQAIDKPPTIHHTSLLARQVYGPHALPLEQHAFTPIEHNPYLNGLDKAIQKVKERLGNAAERVLNLISQQTLSNVHKQTTTVFVEETLTTLATFQALEELKNTTVLAHCIENSKQQAHQLGLTKEWLEIIKVVIEKSQLEDVNKNLEAIPALFQALSKANEFEGEVREEVYVWMLNETYHILAHKPSQFHHFAFTLAQPIPHLPKEQYLPFLDVVITALQHQAITDLHNMVEQINTLPYTPYLYQIATDLAHPELVEKDKEKALKEHVLVQWHWKTLMVLTQRVVDICQKLNLHQPALLPEFINTLNQRIKALYNTKSTYDLQTFINEIKTLKQKLNS